MSYLEDNKRLAKNTIALYIRTFFVLIISLYTSRVLLDVLGVDDFGIYNLVGSIVVLFSFLNTAMTQSIQRYITVELGRNDYIQLRKVFKVSVTSQIIIVLLLIFIIEPFGIWFLNNKLNIPHDRLNSANWAFQFSMITFAINTLKAPYDSTIIAHEKLSFYAYASIAESILKLLIVLSIKYFSSDYLATYSALLSLVSLTVLMIYIIYCRINYRAITPFSLLFDKTLLKSMLSFSGWSLFGSVTNVITQKGFTFLINIFYSVVANAALGISNQISSAISVFIGSFQTSFRPQIIKAYANGEFYRLNRLITQTSKFSFALMVLPTLILIINMPLILDIWLKDVPTYSVDFCRLILICLIFDATTGSYNCAIMATGKIREYQFAVSFSFMIDIIGSYFLIKAGISASYILIMRILTRGILNMIIGLYFMKKLINFNIKTYVKNTLYPILIVLIIIVPILITISQYNSNWRLFFISTTITTTMGIFLVSYILFNQ